MDDDEVVRVVVVAEYRVVREMVVELNPGKTEDDATDPSTWSDIVQEDDVESRLVDCLSVEKES